MAVPTNLPALLDSLTQSLSLTLEATPKLVGVEPPKDGLSLLDVKNELLLSYLQNLVFLILLKLRNSKDQNLDGNDGLTDQSLNDSVVKKLVELRVYLEKGVRPLEDKLRYQVEKVLRAADDAERESKATEAIKAANGTKSKQHAGSESEAESGSDEEEEDDDDDDDASGDEDGPTPQISDMQFRPNLATFVRPEGDAGGARKSTDANGVYRPPKIAPTTMPTTERREKTDRRPLKSATLDEFIATEMSSVPMAEPSVGTTIVNGGRKIKTATDRKKEDERRQYEETNFVRLPKESKKEKAKSSKQEGRRMTFGGEDWRDLGEGVDRINRLTQRKEGSSGTRALLEKSRKRGIDTVDGPRGSGHGNTNIGERYQKKVKTLENQRRRKNN